MKIAIFFDSFVQGGGAEKLVLALAKLLNADVYTSGYKKELYREWVGKIKVFDIGNSLVRRFPRLGFVESALRFAFFKPRQKYDLHIFSGFFSIFAALRLKPNIWYCCQPNRTIYDLKEYQKSKTGFAGKITLELYSFFWKPLDQWIVKKKIQRIISISKTIAGRVKKYYGVESGLIYPPIDSNAYSFESFGDFFFFAGRLIPEKRIELILSAFKEMPEKKIVIVGSGPLAENVALAVKQNKNIDFKGRVSEEELKKLVANCLATIYLPVQEDFIMALLEANAAGKACIAVNEGACLEIIREGKNGLLIKPEKEELKKAVKGFGVEKAKKMKQSCIARAKEFDKKIFEEKWKELVENAFKKNN